MPPLCNRFCLYTGCMWDSCGVVARGGESFEGFGTSNDVGTAWVEGPFLTELVEQQGFLTLSKISGGVTLSSKQ